MQRIELDVKPRDLGQKDVQKNINQLRQEGWIPGVVYGHGNPVSVVINARSFDKAVHTNAGLNALFTFMISGESTLGVVKEVQRHLINHKPIHVDLQRISLKEKLEINVPTHIVGEAPGVKVDGGILEHIQREIRVRCLPDDMPASIDVDVSQLKIGQGIRVSDVTPPKGSEFLTPGDHIIVNIVAAKVEEEAPAPAAPGAVAAQPEVITKGKEKEGAAAAPGAAAPAAPAEKPEKEKKK